MAHKSFTNELQRFIFENIDSIGFLEALLLLHSQPGRPWTETSLTKELRNNPASSASYLNKLEALKLLRKTSEQEYVYDDAASDLAPVIDALDESYRIQRQRIFELVYSSLKKVRDFSDAFTLPGSGGKKEDDDA